MITLQSADAADICKILIEEAGMPSGRRVTLAIEKNLIQVYVKAAVVENAKILALADWLENFWDPCPSLKIDELGLSLIYSHREHVGEGYFQIQINGKTIMQAYEQLNSSNTATAKHLRQALGINNTQ